MQERETERFGELRQVRMPASRTLWPPTGQVVDVPHERWFRNVALSRVIRDKVIPGVVLRHPTFSPAAISPPKLSDEHIAQFVELAIAKDAAPFFAYFDQAIAQGHSPDHLFLSLLAPAACLLGRLWEDDECTFVDVTVGVGRLQTVVSGYRAEESGAGNDQRRLFLTGAPGEQHSLGLAIVEHFMREAGWLITSRPASTAAELRDVVREEKFAVIGLTLSSETRVEPLAEAIRTIRKWSCNKNIGVMVGGPIFLLRPELTSYVGADASAVDGPTAVLLARKLYDLQQTGWK